MAKRKGEAQSANLPLKRFPESGAGSTGGGHAQAGAMGKPGFLENRSLEAPRSQPAWGCRSREVGSRFSSGSTRVFFLLRESPAQ